MANQHLQLSKGSPCVLLLSILTCISSIYQVQGFTPSTELSWGRSSSSVVCTAKKPPTAGIDLEALEAFEAQLDLEDSPEDDSISTEDLDLNLEAADVETFDIPDEFNNMRIDAVIAAIKPEFSRSFCGNLVAEGRVHLLTKRGKVLIDRKSVKVEAGRKLEIHFPSEEKATEILAQDIPLDILFEDEHMIVLNKAANMVVHPAAGNWDGTVVNALAHYLSKSPHGGGDFFNQDRVDAASIAVEGTDGEVVTFRPGIVHRLDKGTTGVLVVAKTTQALAALSEAFAARRVKKTYMAITVGNPGKRVTIDKPIGRHPIHRQRMRVVPDPHKRNSGGMAPKDRMTDDRPTSVTGRRALSFVDSIAFDGKLAFVQVRIETGRTHQIRVHLQDRHTPIYGDDTYGLVDWNKRLSKAHQIDRPLLHAYTLELDHPVTGEHYVFRAPLAEDMLAIARNIYPQGEMELPELFQVGNNT